MWIINLILLQRRWMFRTTGLLQRTRRQMLLQTYRDLQQGGLSIIAFSMEGTVLYFLNECG